MTQIRAENISKIYSQAGVGRLALSDVSLCIHPGELVVITGASGSGKTTLLNILGCLDTPSAGRLNINEQDTSLLTSNELAQLRARHIGFVFQQSHLLSHMTALENVTLPFILSGSVVNEARAKSLLTAVELEQQMGQRPSQLSGGEQQRVAIARALVQQPDIILADEPTGNLDRKTGLEIIRLLAGFVNSVQKCAVVIVTHQPELIDKPQRRFELVDGQLMELRNGLLFSGGS